MTVSFISTLVTVATSAVLGFLVARRAKGHMSRMLFVALTLQIILWSIANYFSLISIDIRWVRAVIALGALHTGIVLLFVYAFPGRHVSFPKTIRFLYVPSLIVFVVLASTPYVFQRNDVTDDRVRTITGEAFPAFAIFLSLSIVWAFVVMVRRFRRAQGIRRLQWKFILTGFLAMLSLEISLLFFYTILTDDIRFIPFAPLFVLPFLGAMTYTIIRYRLFSLRSVVRRSVVFMTTLLIVLIFYALLLVWFQEVLARGSLEDSEAIILVVVIVATYPMLHRAVRAVVDYVFSPPMTARDRALREIRVIREQQGLDETVRLILQRVASNMPIRQVIRLDRLPSKQYAYRDGSELRLPESSPLVTYLRETEEIVIAGELPFMMEAVTKKEQLRYQEIARILRHNGVDFALRLGSAEAAPVLLLVSMAERTNAVSREQIESIKGLLKQTAWPVDNAFLYEQLLKRVGIV